MKRNENARFLLNAIKKRIVFAVNINRILLPFSSQEKGLGDEFFKYKKNKLYLTGH